MKTLLYFLAILILHVIIQSCIRNNDPFGVNSNNNNTENGTWIKVESGVTNLLYDIDFPDNNNGWVVGDSGIILYSENDGEDWKQQTSPTDEILFAVDFIDNKLGWICSRNSILKTSDGGESWEIKYEQDLGEGRFRDIQFLDRNVGFVVGGEGSFGSRGVLLKTEDGGETWQDNVPQSLSTLTHISIVDGQNIWICGFGGTLLSTANIGLTWTKKNLNITPFPSFTIIQFIDHNHGWVGSRDDYLGFYITTDGGKNWMRISEYSFMIIGGVQSFFFIDNNKGWMCNFPFDRIIITQDGGLTWKYNSEIRQRIYSFFFLDNKTGWAVGKYGGILRYSNNNQ
jgi:photosystem II stability/assembly factor-like uncharacterized protein